MGQEGEGDAIFCVEFVCNNNNNKCSTHLRTFSNSSWLLTPATQNVATESEGPSRLPSVAQFQRNHPFVAGGPEPSLSSEASRGRTLRLLLESLSSAYNNAIGLGTSSSCHSFTCLEHLTPGEMKAFTQDYSARLGSELWPNGIAFLSHMCIFLHLGHQGPKGLFLHLMGSLH